jgi:hypothetical protein
MEDHPLRISFFTKSATPSSDTTTQFDSISIRTTLFELPRPLLDSCYYNLFHGTSNLIMGPITIYFLKFAQFICFFMSKYPDMMNPIIIISVFYLVSPLYNYK